MKKEKQRFLSKTLYIKGLQCEKLLWLSKHKPQALTPPGSKKQSRFNEGHKFGALACKLFPNGKEIIFKGTTFDQKIALTQQWIKEGVENIYEATFKYDGILVMADILHINADGDVELNEVKHVNEMRDVYVNDAAIQYYVLNGLGYEVTKVNIIHRSEESENGAFEKMFTIVNVSDKVVGLQNDILNNLNRFRKVLEQKDEPGISMGGHCTSPYQCEAKAYCEKKSYRPIRNYLAALIHFFNRYMKL